MVAIVAFNAWSLRSGGLGAGLMALPAQRRATGGLILMGTAGMLYFSSLSALIGIRLPGIAPSWDVLTFVTVPIYAFVSGLGYGVYRLASAEQSAPLPDSVEHLDGNSDERTQGFGASLAMAFAVMMTGTTGLCTTAMVSFGTSMPDIGGTLLLLAIGLPLPLLGLSMVRGAARRLRQIGLSVAPATPSPVPLRRMSDPGYAFGIIAVAWGTAALLSKLYAALMGRHVIGYMRESQAATDILAPVALVIGIWLLRSEGVVSGLTAQADAPAVSAQAEVQTAPAPVPQPPQGMGWVSWAMLLAGFTITVLGAIFAGIGTPIVMEQLTWGGGLVYNLHRLGTLALAWAVPIGGFLLARTGWRRLRLHRGER